MALLRGEYTIAIIPAIRRMEYVTAREIAYKDKAPFVEFVADCVVSTQEDLLRLLKNSGGVKSLNGGVNKKARGGVNLQQAPHRNHLP